MELLASPGEGGRNRERRVHVCLALVDDGGQRHQLGGRAGLDHVGERTVATVRVRRRRSLVGIEGGGRSQRQDLTAARIHHHDGPVVRTRLPHLLRDGLLGDVLDVTVEGQAHRGAGLCVGHGVGARGDGTTPRPALVRQRSGDTRQLVLVGVLDATEAGALGSHEPDDVRGQVTGWVDAPGRRLAEDARQPQLRDPVPRLRSDGLGDVDEAPFPSEPLGQHRGIDPEDRPELSGHGGRVGHERLVRRQVAGLHRDRQGFAAAVEDGPALRRKLRRAQPLIEGFRCERLATNRLQLHETSGEHGQDDSGGHEEDRPSLPGIRHGEGAAR